MSDKATQEQSSRKNCENCGGSGQICYFGGVSRFVMTWEECPECFGTGYTEMPEKTDNRQDDTEPKA